MAASVQLVGGASSTKPLDDFVTLTDTQTLTNKTLTAPVLTDAVLSNPSIFGDALGLALTELLLPAGTPVNAVAATRVLTVGGIPTAGHTVTIGGTVYTWVSGISVSEATATLLYTQSNVAVDGDTITIDGIEYTFVDALTGSAATSTLTLTGNMTDGNRVVIGSTTYTFRETLASAYDVKIGAAATNTLDNLIAAINGAAGAGTTYGTGTVAHPDVTAVAGAGDTAVITATEIGTAGNAIATLEYSAVAGWTGATMGSGVSTIPNEVLIGLSAEASLTNLVASGMGTTGEGTTYSIGTEAQTNVTLVKESAASMSATANEAGVAGNSITVAEDMTNGSWQSDATALAGGVDAVAEAAYTVVLGGSAEICIDRLVAAINNATGEGSTYGTGTEPHPDVTAAKTNSSTMTVTAAVKGTAANAIALADNDTNTTWAGATMTGGVDGTVADQWAVMADTNYLYIAVAANTTAGQNWRRVALGSAF